MKFTLDVQNELNYYVYRLIDPRDGSTFYIGKGKGNRIFDHINSAIKLEDDEDELEDDADELDDDELLLELDDDDELLLLLELEDELEDDDDDEAEELDDELLLLDDEDDDERYIYIHLCT